MITIIVAMTPDLVIGEDGKIPWRVPEDLRRFKRLTSGHAVIMGRKTHESIGRLLPSRTNIVLTRDPGRVAAVGAGALSVGCLPEALLAAAATDEHPFVIGGAEIYALALPSVARLEITLIARPEHHHFTPRLGGAHLTRFPFDWGSIHWDFRCTSIEAAGAAAPGVEYHTYERR